MSIIIKTAEDIEKMRIAGRLAAEQLKMIGPHIQAGVTTDELNDICDLRFLSTTKTARLQDI